MKSLRDVATSAWQRLVPGTAELAPHESERLRDAMADCVDGRGGDVATRTRAAELAKRYAALGEAGRRAFLTLAASFDVDPIALRAAQDALTGATPEGSAAAQRALRAALMPGRIALLHGRMGARAKDEVMRAFAAHETDILVSTAVVEVGIDVPNATVMAIEGADRFGLAQLHQFRGRVGRGDHASACYLLADDPSMEAEERLSIMERTSDGFELAEADLQLRGPGDLFGTAQSGVPSMRVATLLDEDPDLKRVDHQALKLAIASRTASVVAEMH